MFVQQWKGLILQWLIPGSQTARHRVLWEGLQGKDTHFFHQLLNPRHSQQCPTEKEYLY